MSHWTKNLHFYQTSASILISTLKSESLQDLPTVLPLNIFSQGTFTFKDTNNYWEPKIQNKHSLVTWLSYIFIIFIHEKVQIPQVSIWRCSERRKPIIVDMEGEIIQNLYLEISVVWMKMPTCECGSKQINILNVISNFNY